MPYKKIRTCHARHMNFTKRLLLQHLRYGKLSRNLPQLHNDNKLPQTYNYMLVKFSASTNYFAHTLFYFWKETIKNQLHHNGQVVILRELPRIDSIFSCTTPSV